MNNKKITNWIVAICGSLICLLSILWNLEVGTRLGIAILKQQYMTVQLGLALMTAYALAASERPKTALPFLLLTGVIFVSLSYLAWDFDWLLKEQSYRPVEITIVASVIVVTVLEGIRRRLGYVLFGIVLCFGLYALIADRIPGDLVGRAVSLKQLIDYIGFDGSAVFSSPLAIATTVVILFVFFGRLLFAAGGGAFLTDLAAAAAGKQRGGSAKIAVVGSAMFGSISGSAVSNVVSTGVITIPLMTKSGYKAQDAAAIEAVASTGGQLTPPIMGAAAFLMAEFLEISYLTVVTAALIPAILYYVSVFVQIDLIAGRDNIAGADADNRDSVGQVLKEGWHFLIPITVLLVGLFVWNLDPEDSALLSALAIVVVGFQRGYRGSRLSLTALRDVFIETGTSVVDIILIVAASGFVIGVLNITGLGFALTLFLINIVESQLIILLLISGVVCIVLGMGMPTSGVYVLLATLVAPALVETGIDPIAAHLLILYFGMMSMITPPVALASFTAAMLAKTDPLKTSISSVRFGWAAFIIPFIFVARPEITSGDINLQVISTLIFSTFGIIAVSIAITGYWVKKIQKSIRLIVGLAGLTSLPTVFFPVNDTVHLGATLFILVFMSFMLINRKSAVNA